MKRRFLITYSVFLLAMSCDKKSKHAADTYIVQLTDGKIVFRGIDQPHITNNLPGDRFTETEDGRRHNQSRHERVLAETRKANAALRRLLPSTDTETLIKSIRSGYEGEIEGMDYKVALHGNWIVGAELAARHPIPEELVPESDPVEGGYCPFVGLSGPPLGTFEGFLEYARMMELSLE